MCDFTTTFQPDPIYLDHTIDYITKEKMSSEFSEIGIAQSIPMRSPMRLFTSKITTKSIKITSTEAHTSNSIIQPSEKINSISEVDEMAELSSIEGSHSDNYGSSSSDGSIFSDEESIEKPQVPNKFIKKNKNLQDKQLDSEIEFDIDDEFLEEEMVIQTIDGVVEIIGVYLGNDDNINVSDNKLHSKTSKRNSQLTLVDIQKFPK
ncbi:uncharacterized protein RJT21DRAFT_120002 [Scheffersomyces amazonensis]|uniref:uncharacterized protein n=1 Tax=Scheffersomyces amazonensis TaxID=1078765 RepID=UPI00315C629F